MCLPEYGGCPCVCAERRRWRSLTCCGSRPPATLNAQYQKHSAKHKTSDCESTHVHTHTHNQIGTEWGRTEKLAEELKKHQIKGILYSLWLRLKNYDPLIITSVVSTPSFNNFVTLFHSSECVQHRVKVSLTWIYVTFKWLYCGHEQQDESRTVWTLQAMKAICCIVSWRVCRMWGRGVVHRGHCHWPQPYSLGKKMCLIWRRRSMKQRRVTVSV